MATVKSKQMLRGHLRKSFIEQETKFHAEYSKEKVDLGTLKLHYDHLNDKFTRITQLDTEIFNSLSTSLLTTDEELESEIKETESYREQYVTCKTCLDSITTPIEDGSKHAEQQVATSTNQDYYIKKLNLVTFNGDIRQWLDFWNSFAQVHENEKMPNSTKFHYLLQQTTGEAKELLKSFPAKGDNYLQAVQLLKDTYANERLLVDYYIKEIINLVRFRQPDLSKLVNSLEGNLRALASLGVPSDKLFYLNVLVESSLPDETLTVWQRSEQRPKDHNPSLDPIAPLMKFLRKEVEDAKHREITRRFNADQPLAPLVTGNSSAPTCTTETLVAQVESTSIPGKPHVKCLFCGKMHNSQDCLNARKLPIEERYKIIIEKNACTGCLKVGHKLRACKPTNVVRCIFCDKKHHIIMCRAFEEQKTRPSRPSREGGPGGQIQNLIVQDEYICYLQTLIVEVFNHHTEQFIRVRALLDGAAQRSYISNKLAVLLNLNASGSVTLMHGLFGGLSSQVTHKKYSVTVKNPNTSFSVSVDLLGQERICNAIPSLTNSEVLMLLNEHQVHLDDNDLEIHILLGADLQPKILEHEMIEVTDELVAINTKLGWTIMGKVPTYNQALLNNTQFDSRIEAVDNFWSLQAIGIMDEPKQAKSDTLKRFLNTVSINEEGRYQVAIPWTEAKSILPTNRSLAECRLRNTTNKLLKSKKFEVYDAALREWEKEGIIEEVHDDQKDVGHYLPHRPVFNENSRTTPIRPVFDCSAHCKGSPSLNQCMETGPNLITDLPGLLLRFRQNEIGITADIRKAFLQISLENDDSNYFKFLWWENYSQGKIKVYRHRRVVFGATPSPFFLGAVVDYHLDKMQKYLSSVAILRKSFYVDNFVASLTADVNIEQFIKEAQEIMLDGKFELREWHYNTPNQLSRTDNSITENISVLGMMWERGSDSLNCKVPQLDNTRPLTKRMLLSIVQQIFDPVGLLSPVTVFPKMILQAACRLKVQWDEPLPEHLLDRLKKWIQYYHYLEQCRIPRWYMDFYGRQSIHICCDASKDAYACCIYLRTETQKGVTVRLVQAKSRVAPLKEMTIPRLELMGALIAARLYRYTVDTLQWTEIPAYFWSDSQVVLIWITRNENWSTFVRNRVAEIRNLVPNSIWRHVPGVLNPADLLSRGCHGKQAFQAKWWEGPSWLYESEEQWPSQTIPLNLVEAFKEVVTENLINPVDTSIVTRLASRASKYTKIIRTIAWIYRFINNASKRENAEKGPLTAKELHNAEQRTLRWLQEETLAYAKKGFKTLNTCIDENGLIRVKTKLINDEYEETFKCPILLPHDHRLTYLLIHERHLRLHHAGLHIMLSNVRQKYWVIQARRVIRSVLTKCIPCKRHNATHGSTPPAPLPADRTNIGKAFEVIGTDLAGPLLFADGNKGWAVLFTCAVFRAIHLELIQGLTTEAFIQSFRRFIARRGRPKKVYCDNGTNLTGTENALEKIDWTLVQQHTELSQIEWEFVPPKAPWYGGFWERMIKMVKELLRRNLGKAKLSYEQTNTVLCELEAVINSRPLTYIFENEEAKPLTPALFLQDNTDVSTTDFDVVEEEHLKEKVRQVAAVRTALKLRFYNEYLASLVHYKKSKLKGGQQVDLQVGDVVLIAVKDQKRVKWPLGKVIEILPSIDKVTRSVRLKTSKRTLTRPIECLYPLEIRSNLNLKVDEHVPKVNVSKKDRIAKPVVKEVRQVPRYTRVGREVKPRTILNLTNLNFLQF